MDITLFTVVAVVILVFTAYLGVYRNGQVLEERNRLIKRESAWLSTNPVGFRGKFEVRDMLPGYSYMVLHFWRPVNYRTKKLPSFEEHYGKPSQQ
jgi:hypothetical protein